MIDDTDDGRWVSYRDFNAVQVHVCLDDIEPRIWRRLIVPLDTTLADMHPIIQAGMGWKDSHLHEFEVGGLTYGDTWSLSAERMDDDARVYDSQEVRMRDFSREPGVTFTYIYDFGDNWRHTVTLEKLVAATPTPRKPSCIDGARCCPPEDVGGPSGYFEFLRVLLTPEPDEVDEQRHLKCWSGGRFDPEKFDLVKTDKSVRNALRRSRR
ncbi:MAG: plasmid pRiA4b ORF-3 family protein [Pseudomonadales bacterium]